MALAADQQRVVDEFERCNVVCNGVVGSGKTKVMIEIATRCANNFYGAGRVLILTYNSALRHTIRAKLNDSNKSGGASSATTLVGSVEVHTYHSFGHRYLDDDCVDDDELTEAIERPFNDTYVPVWDAILVDEAQDMTQLYHRLLIKVLRGADRGCMVALFGDVRQEIYGYNGADARYMTLAPTLFGWLTRPWSTLSLDLSWRLSREMVEWYNASVTSPVVLASARTDVSNKVVQLWMKSKDVGASVADQILQMIRSQRYGADDIFVLVPSVRKVDYGAKIYSRLAKHGVAIYNTSHTMSGNTSEMTKGKVVFSSFAKAKGLERKVVFVVGYDAASAGYLGEMVTSCEIAKVWYVALTRASELLVVVSIGADLPKNRPVFVRGNEDQMSKIVDMEVAMSVTTLTREVKVLATSSILSCVTVLYVPTLESKIALPTKVRETKGKHEIVESVSAINGEFIMLEFWTRYMGHSVAWYDCHKSLATKLRLVKERLYAGSKDVAYRSSQIENHYWLTNSGKQIDRCMSRLLSLQLVRGEADANLSIEHPMMTQLSMPIHGIERKFILHGRFDLLQPQTHTIWEFKCCKRIDTSHMLQLLVYGYMYWRDKRVVPKLYLYNVLDDQKVELIVTASSLETTVAKLIMSKWTHEFDMTDAAFIERNT